MLLAALSLLALAPAPICRRQLLGAALGGAAFLRPRSASAAIALPLAHALENGIYWESPPMGWRSWNAFHGDVSDTIIRQQIDALVLKRPVRGSDSPLSLLDLGYSRIGIDDGWQACNTGSEPPSSFHDSTGKPLVNKTKFPDLRKLSDYAASQGVELGFYWNNCIW